jgi:methionine sulfoxide reductase heme-binding subunit
VTPRDPTFWIVARASGLTGYLLLTTSVLAGIVVKARPLAGVKPALVTALHRFLALLGLGAIALHGTALVLDQTVQISPAALTVPGLVPHRPVWTALGVLAFDLMLLVYASFSLRRRIGVRAWRRLHWLTYGVFGLATLHGLAAGTDSGRPWVLALYGSAVGGVLAAAAWRAIVPPTTGGSNHVPDRDRQERVHRLRPVRADGAEVAPARR